MSDRTFTDAARARLVMAYEACELADLARAVVPIGEPGVLTDARRIIVAAQRFFEAAVVAERLGGASWRCIGNELGIAEHAAREDFEAAERRFRAELLDRTEPSGERWWRAYLACEPLEAALDLDDWVQRHQDGDGDLGPAPVSGGLAL